MSAVWLRVLITAISVLALVGTDAGCGGGADACSAEGGPATGPALLQRSQARAASMDETEEDEEDDAEAEEDEAEDDEAVDEAEAEEDEPAMAGPYDEAEESEIGVDEPDDEAEERNDDADPGSLVGSPWSVGAAGLPPAVSLVSSRRASGIAPARAPECRRWCKNGKKPWSKRCPKAACAACEECKASPEEPTPEPKPEPTPEPEPTPAPTPRPTTAPGKVRPEEWEMFEVLNSLRAEGGFKCHSGFTAKPNPTPLVFDCRLWNACRLHSEDMRDENYFSHTSKDGRKFSQRCDAARVKCYSENIAAGKRSPRDTLWQWQQSKTGHCNSLYNPNFKTYGGGFAIGGHYGAYWTQLYNTISQLKEAPDTSCYPEGATAPPTPAPTPAPPTPAPQKLCRRWCKNGKKPWSKRCPNINCAGCEQCTGEAPAPQKLCRNWCKNGKKPWSKRCPKAACAGCEECKA